MLAFKRRKKYNGMERYEKMSKYFQINTMEVVF